MRNLTFTSSARLAPLPLSICMALTCLPSAFAQEQQEQQQADPTQLEQITVTGSRIPRVGFVTPTPVTVLNAEDIRATGAVTLGELINQLPQLATTFSLGNSSRFIGTVGLNFNDLRGLGTDRTLTLVNGRRHVGGSAGSASVDTNTIPVEWIERVEVITGGASAIYGADAVAGVVNFVLKDSFEGYAVRGQGGLSDEGGFTRSFGSFTAGSDFAEGRGSAGISLEISDQNRLGFFDREFGRTNFALLNNPNAPPDQLLVADAGSFSVLPGGSFTLPDGQRFVFEPDGSFRPHRLDGLSGPGLVCSDCDFNPGNRDALLQPDLRRASFNTIINFELAPDHKLFFEGKYVKADTAFVSTPTFSSTNRAPYIISRDNAFVSPELGALMDSAQVSTITLSRNDFDAGSRGEDITRETTRGVLGLEGAFADTWEYELSAVYGRLSERRTNLNNRVLDKFYASIDAVVDPGTGNVVCRSTIDPTSINPSTGLPVPEFARTGCVPTSLFGDGAIDPEAAAFFNTTSLAQTEITQAVLTAVVSQSKLFELPAGPVGFAAGVEYREEESQQQTDPLAAAGLTFLNAIPDQGGEFDVSEIFAEFSVPLLAELPAVQSLTFDLAGRASDYSTVGNTFSWKAGLDWSINAAIRLRGTFAKAVRAPNIGELFDPQVQNFFAVDDPCSVSNLPNAPDRALRQANCIALGVPQGFEAQVVQTREGLSGGNPDLSEEESETYTIGMVFTPEWLPNFGLTIDYWDITVDDAIGALTGQELTERCVDAPSVENEFCPNVVRDETSHEVVFITTINQNLAGLEASGVDIEALYRMDDVLGGLLNLRLLASYYDEFLLSPLQSFPDETLDLVGTSLNGGIPEWRATFSVDYRYGSLKASWRTRYIDELLRVTNEVFAANPDAQSPIGAGSQTYTDIQLSWQIDQGIEVYFGVDNLFDKDPPFGVFGTGATTVLYDNIGRFYYLGFNYAWN